VGSSEGDGNRITRQNERTDTGKDRLGGLKTRGLQAPGAVDIQASADLAIDATLPVDWYLTIT
jgi:hypothetical protein